MPTIQIDGREISCAPGTKLRDALHAAGLSPHNGKARWFNCKGLGSCGTCAVSITGDVGPQTAMERWRLSFPPHHAGSGLRLACQVRVFHDLVVTKHGGFWGQHLGHPRTAPEPAG